MTSNILCKYYMNGACAYGDQCRFSHNKQDEASQVCKFYLQGNCAYGDRCRYEHSKPSWSARGQPAPPSNYTAPAGVQKPPVGPPAGSNGMASASSANPNWDDFMTPDEMDEFEQWQVEQQMAGVGPGGKPSNEDEFGDIMDPAEIPLCNEYAATGVCSAGEDCIYVHGDVCEICGYYCVHPYNPDWTAQHQAACKEAMSGAAAPAAAEEAAAAAGPEEQQQQGEEATPAAAPAAADEQVTGGSESEAAAAAEPAEEGTAAAAETAAAAAAACDAVDGDDVPGAAGDAATAEEVAEKLAETHIST